MGDTQSTMANRRVGLLGSDCNSMRRPPGGVCVNGKWMVPYTPQVFNQRLAVPRARVAISQTYLPYRSETPLPPPPICPHGQAIVNTPTGPICIPFEEHQQVHNRIHQRLARV